MRIGHTLVRYSSHFRTNPGGHLASGSACVCEYVCTCACVRAHMCRCACACAGAGVGLVLPWGWCCAGVALGLVLVLGLGRGLGGEQGGRGVLLRSSLFTHPQNFILPIPGTPGASNKYIINDTGTTPQCKKRHLPGMISERYGIRFPVYRLSTINSWHHK